MRSLKSLKLNCLSDEESFDSGKSIKEYIKNKSIKITDITQNNLQIAMSIVLQSIEKITGADFREEYLDDFKGINKAVLEKEEERFHRTGLFYLVDKVAHAQPQLLILNWEEEQNEEKIISNLTAD